MSIDALSTAVAGLASAQSRFASASIDVVTGSPDGLATAIVTANLAATDYKASALVVRAVDDTNKQLLNILA